HAGHISSRMGQYTRFLQFRADGITENVASGAIFTFSGHYLHALFRSLFWPGFTLSPSQSLMPFSVGHHLAERGDSRRRNLKRGSIMRKLAALVFTSIVLTSAGAMNVHALSEEASNGAVPSLAPMLEGVTPAVVNISTTQTARSPQQFRFFDENDLRRFFNDPSRQMPAPPAERRMRATGSGVIVDAENGYVITNHH